MRPRRNPSEDQRYEVDVRGPMTNDDHATTATQRTTQQAQVERLPHRFGPGHQLRPPMAGPKPGPSPEKSSPWHALGGDSGNSRRRLRLQCGSGGPQPIWSSPRHEAPQEGACHGLHPPWADTPVIAEGGRCSKGLGHKQRSKGGGAARMGGCAARMAHAH